MRVYVDLLFIINFAFDFILLLSVSLILRRRCKIIRVFFGALFGGISIFFLFININSIELFIFKIIISIFMIIITFSFKNFAYFFKNLLYLYMSSIVLGGTLYLLNISFSYKHDGLIFYHNGLSINFIILLIISPIIIYLYIKQSINLRNNYSYYYNISLFFKNYGVVKLTAFLDTGNKLVDPISNKPIILVCRKSISKFIHDNTYEVSFNSLAGGGVIECIRADCINIDGVGVKKNIIIGISDDDFHIDGVNCILNNRIMEGI